MFGWFADGFELDQFSKRHEQFEEGPSKKLNSLFQAIECQENVHLQKLNLPNTFYSYLMRFTLRIPPVKETTVKLLKRYIWNLQLKKNDPEPRC